MSTVRTIKILIKLLPSILALRKDRRKWVKKEGKDIDLEKYLCPLFLPIFSYLFAMPKLKEVV